jgi:probable blue pigment (indigoidine) exporter
MPLSSFDFIRLVAASACWGLGTVLSKAALAHFDPYELLIIQLGASVLTLGPIVVLSRVPFPKSRGALALAGLGILNPGLAYLLGLAGLGLTSASLASLIWALEPALIILAARLVLQERFTMKVAIGAGLGVGGVALVAVGPVSGSLTGFLLILAGVVCCALYAAVTRLIAASGSVLVVVFCQHATALGCAAIFALTAGKRPLEAWAVAPSAARALAALSGVLYYGVAFFLFVGALRRVPASAAGAVINLVPVFGLIAAYLLLNERLGATQCLGAGVVVLAMTLTVTGTRKPAIPYL